MFTREHIVFYVLMIIYNNLREFIHSILLLNLTIWKLSIFFQYHLKSELYFANIITITRNNCLRKKFALKIIHCKHFLSNSYFISLVLMSAKKFLH